MSVALPLLILIASVAGLVGAIAGIRVLGARFAWNPEVSRKAVHVAIGVYAIFLPLLFQAAWPVVLLILVSLAMMVAMRTPRSRRFGLGATIHAVGRRSFGDIWLALAIGFVFLHSRGSYILYALPIAVIALADAAAALAGSTYGRRLFVIEGGVKSWEGVIAFFAVTLILAMIMLLLLTDVGRINVIVVALTVAAFAATVEAISWRGLDNLFVPIGTHLFLAGYLDATPWTLAGLAAFFAFAVLTVMLLAPVLRLSTHASQAYVIALFLFFGVAGLYGTLLPVLVMAAHLAARTRQPCRAAFADLDLLASLCAMALIWYFVGETAGRSAISLYNLSVAGVLLGYLLILSRLTLLAAVASVGVYALYLAMLGAAPADGAWLHALPVVALGALAVVALPALAKSDWFVRWRAPRLAGLASLVPLAAYLSQRMAA